MAANTDKARKHKSLFSTTLSGDITNTANTIGLTSTSGLATDTAITLTINRVDSNGDSTPLKMERVTGVISGSNLTNSLRGEDSSTGLAASSGDVVEDIWDAETWNDFVDAFLAEHSQLGAHTTDSIAEKSGGSGVTVDSVLLKDGGVSLGSTGDFKLGASSVGILSSGGLQLIIFTQTSSAVNELTIANAATNNGPQINASGGDTNVDIEVNPKGTGVMKVKTTVELSVKASDIDTVTGDAQAFFRVPKELDGYDLVAVAAVVYAAGTTNTTDIQIRNKTDTADMLSTVITIDSGETDTSTAATPAVIDGTKDDVVEGDVIAVDVDAVSTTEAKGLKVQLTFAKP